MIKTADIEKLSNYANGVFSDLSGRPADSFAPRDPRVVKVLDAWLALDALAGAPNADITEDARTRALWEKDLLGERLTHPLKTQTGVEELARRHGLSHPPLDAALRLA